MMPFKKNKKSQNDAATASGNKKAEKETLSPSTSKSPVESKAISSYFASPTTSESSTKTDDKQPKKITSKDATNEDENKKEKGANTTEKDNQMRSQEEKQGESLQQDHETRPKSAAALRQLLLSPKKDSGTGQKKKTTKSRNKGNKKDEISKQPAITEHFVVRRSQRKCKSKLEEEKRKSLETAILEGKEDGLEIKEVEGKGRGVFASKLFERGDLVCEYAGELIDLKTAKEREEKYSQNKEIGCYMYYFAFGNKKYCVDATGESGRLGRLLNHSVNGNCTTKVISIKDDPYLILIASKHIKPGEELLYDYGERDKDAIASHPWLQQ